MVAATDRGLVILLNNGHGRFRPPAIHAAGTKITDVAIADLNGDGRRDVVAVRDGGTGAWGSGGRLRGLIDLYPGTLLGGLGLPVTLDRPDLFTYTPSIAVADFNGDGKRDILAVSCDRSVMLFGRGDGTFDTRNLSFDHVLGTSAGLCSASLVAADFDRNGTQDIATGNFALRGVGDGTFTGSTWFVVEPRVLAQATGDFNRDGRPDLMVTRSAFLSGQVRILSGGFDLLPPIETGVTAFTGVAAADLDGDGWLDAALTGDRLGQAVSVLLGRPGGSMEWAPKLPHQGYGHAIAASDLDGDGKTDLLLATQDPQTGEASLYVLRNTTGYSSPFLPYVEATPQHETRWLIDSLKAGDMDGDGKLSVTDVLTGLRITAGIDPLTTVAARTGNLTGTNRISVTDSIAVLKTVAGFTTPDVLKAVPIPGLSAVTTLPPELVTPGGATLRGEVALDSVPADGTVEYHFRLRRGAQQVDTARETLQARQPTILQIRSRVEWLHPQFSYEVQLVVTRPQAGEGEWVAFTTPPAQPPPPAVALTTLDPEESASGLMLRGRAVLPPGLQGKALFRLRDLTGTGPDGASQEITTRPPLPLVGTGAPQDVRLPAASATGVDLRPNTLYSVALVVEQPDGSQEQATSVQFRTGFEVVEGVDSDGDGFSDADETAISTDPNSAASTPALFAASPLVSYRSGPGAATGGAPSAARPPSLGGGTVSGVFYSGSTGADGPLLFLSPPPSSDSPKLAYDSDRQVAVLLHGNGARPEDYQTTWEWDGVRWTARRTEHSPGSRQAEARVVYDSRRRVMVLFGGRVNEEEAKETWEYDGVDWRVKRTATVPPVRLGHSMAYDAARGVVLLTGGLRFPDERGFLSETWAYDGSDWRLVSPANPGLDLRDSAMAYDARRQKVVLYGGYHAGEGSNGGRRTWEWDGSGWTQAPTEGDPGLREGHRMAYDPVRGQVLMIGNLYAAEASHELWGWDGRVWQRFDLPVSPPGRRAPGLAFDEARGQLVLFGGSVYGLPNSPSGGAAYNDTWLWDGFTWLAPAHLQPDILIDLSDRPEGVYHYTTIDVGQGVRVRFTGGRPGVPVVWLASGDVSIAGEVSLDGQVGPPRSGPSPVPGAEARGGPGGFGGGRAADAATGAPPYPGLGPGGSHPAESESEWAGYAGHQGTGGRPRDGSPYGTRLLFPLLGGSGGGGGLFQGGGGGGGALLLAGSGIIRVDGAIHADSGSGGGISGGGTGSGGALRLVANEIHGTGSVLARTLGHSLTRGRVRLEAFRIAPALQTEQAAVTAPPIALEPRRPALIRVLSVAGQPVVEAPGGLMGAPDVVFQAAGEVTVELQTAGVPEGTVLTVRGTGEGRAVTVESAPVDAQGRAAARLPLPRGDGTLQAYATYRPTAARP